MAHWGVDRTWLHKNLCFPHPSCSMDGFGEAIVVSAPPGELLALTQTKGDAEGRVSCHQQRNSPSAPPGG